MSKYGFSFSWKRALGVTAAKQKFAREIGIERKLDEVVLGYKSCGFSNYYNFAILYF